MALVFEKPAFGIDTLLMKTRLVVTRELERFILPSHATNALHSLIDILKARRIRDEMTRYGGPADAAGLDEPPL